MKFLEVGRLSAGEAAHLAGLPVPVFLASLADHGVAAVQTTEAEAREDAQREIPRSSREEFVSDLFPVRGREEWFR